MLTSSKPNSENAAVEPPKTQKTLIVVSHTHWDREWYLTFQQYRFKLVRLIDRLLHILDTQSDYAYFMLDGQTIVLEDYLEVRPERRPDLERHIRSGRLLVGPWYILADQFLVSGEAHIQNLLRGMRIADSFGGNMRVGYIPDPFGHTGQMPQILRGMGIDSAVFWRGVGPEIGQVEFVWLAPDGTSVDGVHLPGTANIGGYSTALAWNQGSEAALLQLKSVKDFVIEPAKSGLALLMNGNDHVEPVAEIPAILRQVQAALDESGQPYRLEHGTLPMYLERARQTGIWQRPETPRHVGEFRDSRLAHLLPGVLSSRMPIKQWNTKIEGLLEREVGPAIGWAASLPNANGDSYDPASLRAMYSVAWKYLLQNHPHDSICGCSIDQVHDEMLPRFAQAEQIGNELLQEGQRTIVRSINTATGAPKDASPLVIFNAVPLKRTEIAALNVTAGEGLTDLVVTDATGEILPHRLAKTEQEMLFNMDIPAYALQGMSAQAGDEGRIMDYTMASIEFLPDADPKVTTIKILAIYQSAAPTDPQLMANAMQAVEQYIHSGTETFRLAVYRNTSARLEFLAKDVPPVGYKTFYLRPRQTTEPKWQTETLQKPETVENEFYELSVDPTTGLFTVLDKETGVTFSGLNQFRDGGDAGDEYNYSPPTQDTIIEKYFAAPDVQVKRSKLENSILVSAALELPYSLSDDRQTRGTYKSICPITTIATLVPGQRRIDFKTIFVNDVEDHRLQVLFPAGFIATTSHSEQAFDVVERGVGLPVFDKNWREDPVPTAPQKTFVSLYDPARKIGLSVFNQGLPEYEIAQTDETSAIGLTLLRGVGWLSRSDLQTRRDHAGPGLPTPAAQLHGEQTFYYSIMPHKGDWLQAGAQQQAHAFNHPLSGTMAALQTGQSLAASLSFVEILPRVVALSTVKPSEDGKAVIVRIWNPATRDIPETKLQFYRQPKRASLVNLAETQTLQELTVSDNNQVSFALPAKRIATVRLEF